MSKKLLLFDIDGTLLRAGTLSVDSYAAAFTDVLGSPYSIREVECAGRTDPYIVKQVLEKYDHSDCFTDTLLTEIFDRFLQELEQRVDEGAIVDVIEGVQESLAYLVESDVVALGLLTGNLEAGAYHKLRAGQLEKYFPVGAYGSDNEDRNQLGKIALQRASLYYKTPFKEEDVFIIGDSVYDVQCARAAGFSSVAVSTGKHSIDELANECPSFLIEQLSSAFFAELL